MAATQIVTAKRDLIAAFIEYADWDGSAYAPFAVAFGTKVEGNPASVSENPETTFPALAVQANWKLGRRYGIQQEVRFSVRVSVIHHWAAGEQPETDLEDTTGRMIDNIIRSKDEEGTFIGLDWVADIPFPTLLPSDNDLNMYLRTKGVDQDADGGGYCASQTDFTVVSYLVPE